LIFFWFFFYQKNEYFRTTFHQHFPSFWSITPQEEQVPGEDQLNDIPFDDEDVFHS
jgi:hypothetical protein